MTRAVTSKLIDMADNGILSWETVAMACLNYMSEFDVADMARTEFDVHDDGTEYPYGDDEAETGE